MKLDLTDLTKSTQDRVLQVIDTIQGSALGGVKAWKASVDKMLPGDATLVDRLPGAGAIPSPAEMVELSYGFASKVLANQQHFVEQLVAVAVPTRPATVSTAKVSAAAKS